MKKIIFTTIIFIFMSGCQSNLIREKDRIVTIYPFTQIFQDLAVSYMSGSIELKRTSIIIRVTDNNESAETTGNIEECILNEGGLYNASKTYEYKTDIGEIMVFTNKEGNVECIDWESQGGLLQFR